MCGIAALLGDLPSDQIETSLRAMLDAQAHRGPDDSGSVVISAGGAILGLGNRRLAIQDISPLGHQPMRNENTGDILVYNGEIYNAPDLKKSCRAQVTASAATATRKSYCAAMKNGELSASTACGACSHSPCGRRGAHGW